MAGVRVSERGESDVGIGYGAAGDPPVTPVRASLGEIARYFARLGVVAFGGPTAHISMMQEELVEQRRWVDRQYFVDMLAATQLAPGPNSTEMAIHVGWLHQGRRGLVVAGVCFILPAFLIVLGISLVYGVYGALPEVAALFYGMQPVIVAIIMVAVVRNPSEWAVAMTSSHSVVEHLWGASSARTRSTRISAPPPGMDPSPASMRRRITSATLRWKALAKKTISGGEKPWT